jgi:hypothetical protein
MFCFALRYDIYNLRQLHNSSRARIALLRSFNRRAQYALPWLPMRSAQEGSAILGGLSGFGASPERAGRTWDLKSESLVSISAMRVVIITGTG